jgi:hypothetical protein
MPSDGKSSHCLWQGELIRNGAKTISLQTTFGRFNNERPNYTKLLSLSLSNIKITRPDYTNLLALSPSNIKITRPDYTKLLSLSLSNIKVMRYLLY